MLSVIHVQIRHLSKDLACHPGLVLPLKIVIVQATPPVILLIAVAFQRSAITNHSFLAPDIATIGDSVRGSPLLLNEWESPSSHSKWFRLQGPCLSPWLGPSPQDRHRPSDASSDLALAVAFQGALSRTIRSWRPILRQYSRESPSPKQVGVAFKGFPLSIMNGFASRGSPSPSGWDSPQGVPPLYSEWDSLQGGPLLQVNGIHLKGFPLSSANGIRFMGVPFSKANGIRLMEVPPIQGVPFSKWMGFTSRGSPSPQRIGFASRESPSPKRMGFASRGSPYPMRMRVASRGSPLSNANGIRFKGVPFSKANGIRFKGFPLSTATVFRFKGPCFTSTSALIPCFVWG